MSNNLTVDVSGWLETIYNNTWDRQYQSKDKIKAQMLSFAELTDDKIMVEIFSHDGIVHLRKNKSSETTLNILTDMTRYGFDDAQEFGKFLVEYIDFKTGIHKGYMWLLCQNVIGAFLYLGIFCSIVSTTLEIYTGGNYWPSICIVIILTTLILLCEKFHNKYIKDLKQRQMLFDGFWRL